MTDQPKQLTLDEWEARYAVLAAQGLIEPTYGGPLSRHVSDGDARLPKLMYDNSVAALNLWNLLLTEEERLANSRERGIKLVGTMKDLGTVPVMVYSLPNAVAFYPDGAWWTPCIMEMSAELLSVAAAQGFDDTFCPVRAMLGAFVTKDRFPMPDLLTCSVGATCDDFSAIAQRVERLGYPILWWEMPVRRQPDPDEPSVQLPGGFVAPTGQISYVRGELQRIRHALEALVDGELTDDMLRQGIHNANAIRRILEELRTLAYTAEPCPMGGLEMLIAEMLAIHFCSSRDAALQVLTDLLDETRRRVSLGVGPLPWGLARVFWVNPVADLRVMNLLEACGGRVCGTEYLFSHALDQIPEDIGPMEALARMAIADSMVGSSRDRANRICADAARFGAEAVIISRIPGASHCALEGYVIAQIVRQQLGLPVVEIEVPPNTDAMAQTLRTRMTALVETVLERRRK